MKVFFDLSATENNNRLRGVGVYSKNLYENLRREGKEGIGVVEGIEEADILHYSYFDPFFLTLPYKKHKKTIVTVHDLIPLKFSEHFPCGFRGRVKWELQRWKLQQADAIITDSVCSKKDIIYYAGIPADKIHIVYLAPSSDFTPQKIKKKNYILYVGDVNWNKNIQGLLEAFSGIRDEFPELVLMLAGTGFFGESREAREIKILIEKLEIKDRVVMMKDLIMFDLVTLYNQALCYIQPSFYEGFGLPVLEAMACGCPVISSNQSSLPEICGQAAAMFDPYKQGELEKIITKLLKSQKTRDELSVKGIEQAKKFSWEKTTKETIKVYQQVLL